MIDAIKIYRIGRKFYNKKLYFLSKILYHLNYFLHNSHIPNSVEIGENSKFAYGGIGLVIHHNAKIGKNCMIGQGVTIGGKFGSKEVPIIEDNVYIGAGVRILGNIKIGKNSIIAPNSVVLKDVLPYSVMAGVPAKKINYITEKNIEKYKGYGIDLE